MRNVLLRLDDETGNLLEKKAKEEFRSVKAMAEKIVFDNVHKRSDGFTDEQYMRLKGGKSEKA